MSLETENRKKLKDFFGVEYRSLKNYVNSRIKDSANRDAEDILQDVALKLFSGADRYAPINNVAGFVYRSIKNKIVDVRRSSKLSFVEEIDHEFSDLSDMLHQNGDNQPSEEMIAALKRSLDQLKPHYREIIIAVDFEGYSYNEISKETDIPIGTLMSRRHRAIGILYNKLETEIKNDKK